MFVYSFLNFLIPVKYAVIHWIVWLILTAISYIVLFSITERVAMIATRVPKIWFNIATVLAVVTIFVGWGYLVVEFGKSYVYVPKGVTVLAITSDGTQSISEKGWHKIRHNELIFWLEMDSSKVSVKGRSDSASAGTIVVFDMDLRNIDRASFYDVFGCQSDLCVLKIVSQKIQDTYFKDGCIAIPKALKIFKKYGLDNVQITYCD